MSEKHYFCLVILGILLLGIIIIDYSKKSQECIEGFYKINDWCETEKTNFECTDKILAPKQIFVCGRMSAGSIISEDYLRELSRDNKTVHVKGRIWDSYQLLTDEIQQEILSGGGPQVTKYRYIEIESMEIVD